MIVLVRIIHDEIGLFYLDGHGVSDFYVSVVLPSCVVKESPRTRPSLFSSHLDHYSALLSAKVVSAQSISVKSCSRPTTVNICIWLLVLCNFTKRFFNCVKMF